MIYQRKKRRSRVRAESIQIEQENTRARMSGFENDGYVQLKDEQGTIWAGLVEQGPGDLAYYRLRDATGRSLSGVGTPFIRIFRDDRNKTWKGVVE
jgi:hypothetical protein